MDHLPTWLAAAIDAAGVSTVYNADDWGRIVENLQPANEASAQAPAAPH